MTRYAISVFMISYYTYYLSHKQDNIVAKEKFCYNEAKFFN